MLFYEPAKSALRCLICFIILIDILRHYNPDLIGASNCRRLPSREQSGLNVAIGGSINRSATKHLYVANVVCFGVYVIHLLADSPQAQFRRQIHILRINTKGCED